MSGQGSQVGVVFRAPDLEIVPPLRTPPADRDQELSLADKHRSVDRPVVPFADPQRLARLGIPDAQRFIQPDRRQALAILRDRHPQRGPTMPLQPRDRFALWGQHQHLALLGGPAGVSRRHNNPLRRPAIRHPVDGKAKVAPHRQWLFPAHLPEPDRFIIARGDKLPGLVGEGDPGDIAAMPLEHLLALQGLVVPDHHLLVAPSHQPLPIGRVGQRAEVPGGLGQPGHFAAIGEGEQPHFAIRTHCHKRHGAVCGVERRGGDRLAEALVPHPLRGQLQLLGFATLAPLIDGRRQTGQTQQQGDQPDSGQERQESATAEAHGNDTRGELGQTTPAVVWRASSPG